MKLSPGFKRSTRGRSAYRRGQLRTPKKGTKLRQVLLHMMSPQGLTTDEAFALGLVTTKSLTGWIRALEDECGFDVRTFPLQGLTRNGSTLIYRIVGRNTPQGYRSFVQGCPRSMT